jgi:iron-sulfur cluster assembly accessory protein
MTESAYRPQTLDPPPPPPRNADIPNTSIAGAQQDRFAWTPSHISRLSKAEQSASSYSLPEREAQQSIPVTKTDEPQTCAQPAQQSSPVPAKKAARKLRPRKAAMTLTPTAVSQLRALQEDPDAPKLIRVGVKNKGCSGSAYHLEYVDKPGKFDEQVEQDGVKVLVDSKALLKIIGSEMDWVEDKLAAQFVFRNPNVSKYSSPPIGRLLQMLICVQLSNAGAVNHLVCRRARLRWKHGKALLYRRVPKTGITIHTCISSTYMYSQNTPVSKSTTRTLAMIGRMVCTKALWAGSSLT